MDPPIRLPRVCVLMSTFNGERFLEAQLDSLLAQQDVEVVLHARDDGSTDRTLEILARYSPTWPSLAAPGADRNLGAARSFLELLRTSPDDADYYAFCDQDDVWLPGKLARATAALKSAKGPALYCSNVTCVDADLKVLGTPRENGDGSLQHLLFENIAYGCTTVMNRGARELVVARPPERGLTMHDWWCALLVAAFGSVRFDPEPMILYRQHGANAVGAELTLMAQAMIQVRNLLRGPSSYYRIHAQASELLRLYGDELAPGSREAIARLVRSKRSFVRRAQYALSGEIVRSHLIGSVVARGLVLAGWY